MFVQELNVVVSFTFCEEKEQQCAPIYAKEPLEPLEPVETVKSFDESEAQQEAHNSQEDLPQVLVAFLAERHTVLPLFPLRGFRGFSRRWCYAAWD